MECSAPPSSHSHVCRLVPSVFVFLCLSVCVSLFQVALTCSMPPTVPPKRISPSLTACALPPLSSLVLTHVFVSVHTESVLFPPSLSVTSHLHHSVSGILQTGPFQLATLAALFCCFWRGFLATVWYWSGSVCFNWVWNGDPGEQKRKPGRTTSKEKAAVETQTASPSQGLCRLIKQGW